MGILNLRIKHTGEKHFSVRKMSVLHCVGELIDAGQKGTQNVAHILSFSVFYPLA